MPIIPSNLVRLGPRPSVDELQNKLLNGETLVNDSIDHRIEVVDVLKSYGEVLNFYSINLIYQSERQFLNPFPIFKFLDGDLSLSKIWKHIIHDRINFEYAEYCMRAMLWHGTGGLDSYLDSSDFKTNCELIIARKIRNDPLLRSLHPLFPQFLPELIRTAATTNALGQFWRVMSDLFIDLATAESEGNVANISDVVDFIKQGLISAASNPISYSVQIDSQQFWVLPPQAGLTFLVDVAVPYVEAVFLRGTPFLGTVSYNAQSRQISPDQQQFRYGALFADPLPIMGSGVPPSLLMQDMFRHLPKRLNELYKIRTRGEGDVRVKICMSFQKSMFCVTNAAINGTFPYSLQSEDPLHKQANIAYANSWAVRLSETRTDCLGG